MATHTVTSGQCLLDVAIQQYGSAGALFDLALDNNLEVDDDIFPGQVLQIRDTLPDSADPDLVDYFVTNGYVINSGAPVTIIEVLADNDGNIIADNDGGGFEA